MVGKVVWLGALAAVAGRPRAEVEERLHALERKEFVRRERRSSVAAETQFAFRHVLVRDVAYAQIPRGRRADKHRRAAEWIESLAAAAPRTTPSCSRTTTCRRSSSPARAARSRTPGAGPARAARAPRRRRPRPTPSAPSRPPSASTARRSSSGRRTTPSGPSSCSGSAAPATTSTAPAATSSARPRAQLLTQGKLELAAEAEVGLSEHRLARRRSRRRVPAHRSRAGARRGDAPFASEGGGALPALAPPDAGGARRGGDRGGARGARRWRRRWGSTRFAPTRSTTSAGPLQRRRPQRPPRPRAVDRDRVGAQLARGDPRPHEPRHAVRGPRRPAARRGGDRGGHRARPEAEPAADGALHVARGAAQPLPRRPLAGGPLADRRAPRRIRGGHAALPRLAEPLPAGAHAPGPRRRPGRAGGRRGLARASAARQGPAEPLPGDGFRRRRVLLDRAA